ncbi:MAG: hypothetical protein EON89_11625 [Brevundimonas sp.]|nr:MAG: hypothetical protein EON89_11625 [Brevundimonas sp.]
MTDPTDMDEDGALAGELALRVLSPEEESAARAREQTDPAFAGQVEAWNERLGTLAEGIAPVQPSPGVWPRVEGALPPTPANDNARLTFWRRWAIGSTGLLAASIAAVAVLAVQTQQAPVTAPPPVAQAEVVRVATLSLEQGGKPALTLVYDPNTENLYLSPTEAMAGDTRVPHLWLVMPEGGVQLVGAIDGSEASRHHMAGLMSTKAGQATAVAVSMEAPGHTPAVDKPDGPVVAAGELQRL